MTGKGKKKQPKSSSSGPAELPAGLSSGSNAAVAGPSASSQQTKKKYVRVIVGEKTHQYQIEVRSDTERGERYASSWQQKSQVDQQLIKDWEARKASIQSYRSSASAQRTEWAHEWLTRFNNILNDSPHGDNPHGSTLLNEPNKYWELAFKAVLDFEKEAKNRGYAQEDFHSDDISGRMLWVGKNNWDVVYEQNPFEAAKYLQVLVHVVAATIDRDRVKDDKDVQAYHGHKLLLDWEGRMRDGLWVVDQEYLKLYYAVDQSRGQESKLELCYDLEDEYGALESSRN